MLNCDYSMMTLAVKAASVLLLVAVSGALVVQERQAAAGGAALVGAEEAHKDSRFFFVSVKPETCTTTSTTYPTGTCYKPTDCSRLGGAGAGSCALGIGTCCYFVRTCGAFTVGTTNTFTNPTTTTNLACQLEVRLVSSNICQLRLDFKSFALAPPNADGDCVTDSMTVTGTGGDAAVPTLCGTNTGQHMYIDVNPTVGNPKINIATGATAYARSWNMNVKQIPCDSTEKAPTGCTQYYTATTGIVQSFNYVTPTAAQIAAGTNTVHLNDQHYRVCVASGTSSCIQWLQNTAAAPYAFMLSGEAAGVPPALLGTEAVSSRGTTACSADYVLIPGGTFNNGAAQSADRYCGLGFPNVVSSSLRPYNMYVNTDASETLSGDAGNVGFNLRYRLSTNC